MLAAITVDVDTLNDYAYSYGIKYKRYPDLVYTKGIPRLLDILKKYNIKATFFVVGRDLNIPQHLKILKSVRDEGHETANHSFSHYHDFNSLPKSIQKKEIISCHEIVSKKLKLKMKGFRAPGYNISNFALKVLEENNYQYDSSLFPTTLLPAFKLATVLASRGKYKSTGGGKMSSIFSNPTANLVNNAKIMEVPISVTPIARIPFMGTFNLITGRSLFSLSLKLFEKFKRDINYEFHPIELLDFKKDKIPKMFYRHPGSRLSLDRKLGFYNFVISEISKSYNILTLSELVKNHTK